MNVASTKNTDRPTPEHATDRMLRSCLLRLLALSLGYPTVDRFEAMRTSLETCIAFQDRLPKRIADRLSKFAAVVRHHDHARYESEYLKVFTHVCAADCNPCETSYMAKHIFQVSQRMAAITGFYRAFGLETSGERPDHIAVELEFLAFLCYRESLECMEGSRRNALTMRQGQRRFLERHLGKWVGAFTVLMRRKAQTGAMHLLADLLESVVKSEAARHRVSLGRFRPDAQPFVLDWSDSNASPLTLATGHFAEGVFHG